MAHKQGKVVFIGTNKECDEVEKILEKSGFKCVKTLAKKQSLEEALIEEIVLEAESIEDCEILTPLQLKYRIDNLTGKNLSLLGIGKAMSSLRFIKTCKRIGGLPKAVYIVKISERWIRFAEAKEKGLIISGINIKDFDNPDEFNLAIENAK